MKKNKKRIMSKASIGMSLLLSSVLLCGSALKTYAQADLTPEENQKLTEFLATNPTNGARTSLGLTNNVSHSNYTFPGRNNFTSVFESRSTKTKLDKDYDFVLDDGDHAGETVHIKNWQDLEVFDLSTAEPYGPDYSMGKYMFAKQVTFVTDNGTEFVEHNVALPVDIDGGERFDKTAYPNRYVFDYPIEEEDSRFTHDIMGLGDMAASGATGYWQITATVNEEIPYNTIAEIDENLKQGEIVEVTQGAIGNKIGTFNLTIGDDLGSRYLDYDADVIYNDLKDLFSTSSIQKDAFFIRDWGMATFVEGGSVDPKERLLHVGIDYTQYVTEDGTELKTKEYGVHEKDTFAGYEYVTTRTEANGDTVHVYKKVVTPTPTPEPEQPVTPTDHTPTQSETPINPTPQPEVPGNNNTPETPGDNSGNINGGNDENPEPSHPTDPTPEVPTPTPNPTPNPTPEPEHPVEDNTPVVPTPTPEPSAPVEETPNQPGNPTNPVNETPVNPTPEPEKPTVVEEEKPVNNNTEVNNKSNTENHTYSEQKIEDKGGTPPTGDRLFIHFATFLTTTITGLGTIVIRNKSKED